MKSIFILFFILWNWNLRSQTNSINISNLKDNGYPIIEIQEGEKFKTITPDVYFLKNSDFTLEEIRNKKNGKLFKKINSNSMNLGISKDKFWLKFKLENFSTNENWILEFGHPHVKEFKVYEFLNDKLVKNTNTGTYFPLSSKEIPNKSFLFTTKLKFGEEKEYYFYLKSGTSMILSLNLWEKDEYIVQASIENYLYGIYLGIMLVMVFYNVFIFISVKETTYLYYILYIICFTIMQESKNGFAYITRLQNYPGISNNIVSLFIPLAIIFSVSFTKKFLNTKANSKYSHYLLNLLTMFAVVVAILSFILPSHIALASALFSAGFWSFVMFGVSLNSLLKGYRPARIFFLAWLFLIVSVFISALNVIGILNDNFFTLHCMEIGSAIEVILLSLALADRINILKKENETAQKEILNKQITLSKSFARFVPFELLEILNKKLITDVELGDAVEKEMTVLFTDIRNYTTISEKLSPQENFRFLNHFLKDIGPIIRSNHGVIDKFIGDSIMALFPGKAEDAVKSAIEISSQLKVLNEKLKKQNYPPIEIGIGINTGKLILGTVGEVERMEATVISDTVNLASRIESLTKYYHCETLIGEDTIKNLKNTEDFDLRLVDNVIVKGKKNPILLYQVFSESRKIPANYKKDFETTIELYRQRKFKKAKTNFQKLLKINPQDHLINIYINRCDNFVLNPPAKDWSGASEMNSK